MHAALLALRGGLLRVLLDLVRRPCIRMFSELQGKGVLLHVRVFVCVCVSHTGCQEPV